MKKLSVKHKNWLLSAHVVCAALWTGTVLSISLVAWQNRHTPNGDELYALNLVISWLDVFIVIPSAIASVITATFLCWLTNYGFFKFYWVIAKWVLTTALIIFGTFWLYPWSEAATSISNTIGEQAFANPLYLFDTKGVLIGGAIQALCLFVIIGISVIKPWGRRKSETREQNKPVASS